MIIIGSGIAGAMARGYFSSLHPIVYDAKENSNSSHKAIMHFKDFSVGYLLGVPLEKVKITKGIYYNGDFVQPNPALSNLYSKKVSYGIFGRSINSIDSVDRFIAKTEFKIPSVEYGKRLIKIEPNKCYFSDETVVDYDVCISTIPLPSLAAAAGIDLDPSLAKAYPICVSRYPVKIDCEVFQTVYFPDPKTIVYRASLEEQTLIIESQGKDAPNQVSIDNVLDAFGLGREDIGVPEIIVQSMGKMVSMDDTTRRQIIVELTDKFNVFSLGRYAIWKSITSDALIPDLKSIANMIHLTDPQKKYNSKLEMIK